MSRLTTVDGLDRAKSRCLGASVLDFGAQVVSLPVRALWVASMRVGCPLCGAGAEDLQALGYGPKNIVGRL